MKKAKLTAATLLVITSLTVVCGCGNKRSNLLPGDSATAISANLDKVDQLVRDGNCFEALNAAEEARNEVEALSGDVDPVLRRNLLDGVTELQIQVQKNCVESNAEATPTPPADPAPTPDTTTSDGTTGTSGNQGQQGGDGVAKPDSTPTPTPTPTPNPSPTPTPENPGSGGVAPGSGGVGP